MTPREGTAEALTRAQAAARADVEAAHAGHGLARQLVACGLPVILGTRSTKPGQEYTFPNGYESLPADLGHLARWTPDHGLALVTGHGLDGVDVDTKNGADVEAERARLERCGLLILGETRTPSGGAHFYVLSSGLPKRNLGAPVGVDLIRGRLDGQSRGLLYMPGTRRPKYGGLGYEWVRPLDVDSLPEFLADADLRDEQAQAAARYEADLVAGTKYDGRTTAAGGSLAHVEAEPIAAIFVQARLSERLAEECQEGQRSQRFHHLVGLCLRDGMTAGQAVTLLEPWCARVGKYVGRVAQEVARSWPTLAEEWAAEQRAARVAVEDVPGTSPEPEPWDEPMPLGGGTPEPVPLDGLPGFLRHMVEAVAEQSQAPREVVLAAALGTLAAATRGVWDVHVRGGWNAGPSVLWVTALAASGERKGAGTKPLTAPLIDAERHLASEVRRANRNRETERKGLEASLKTADADGDPTGWQRLAERIHEARPRPVPGLVISDATTEALGQYMTGQGGACAIFGTEASSFQTVAGRYSDAGGNFSLLNNAYDGEPYADLRIKRDGVRVERPALTWSVAVQPDVLAGYADAQSEGSGFLARFLLLVPASNIGKLNYRSEPVPDAVAAEWARVVEGLHAEAWRRYEAMTESLPDDLGPPSSVTFTDDAAELVIQYGERLDREAGDGGAVAYLGGWASKAPARIARLAAVLALAEDPHRRDVRPEHVAAALTLADALTSHASAAFGILRQAARLDPAARIVEALRKLGEPLVTTRDVWQAVRRQTSWVDSTDDVRRALDGAEDLGYVRRLPKPSGSNGGRPSERWEVHPSITG